MSHATHSTQYLVLSAGQVSCTLGKGIGLDRLLKVLSTARYGPSKATEGIGREEGQVLQVQVPTALCGLTRPIHVELTIRRPDPTHRILTSILEWFLEYRHCVSGIAF